MRIRQAGFTLLELTTVIAVIGVLAAAAALKFMDTNTAARASAVTSAARALESANRQVYASAAVKNITTDDGSRTTCNASSLQAPTVGDAYVNVGGYYVCTIYGFAKDATQLEPLLDRGDMVLDNSGTSLDHSTATTAATCRVTYTPPLRVNTVPTYTINISNCS
jgi:prepilin-type N-terminal cleavage/methylation domain-containing protein